MADKPFSESIAQPIDTRAEGDIPLPGGTATGRDQRVTRLDSLTSLRWFAALIVFLRHGNDMMSPTGGSGAYDRVTGPGAVGVSFFFILSGFVLTWSARSGDSASAFYRRRFARIAPSYWVAGLLGIPITLWVTGYNPLRLGAILFGLTGLQAWVPTERVYFAGDGVLWSVSNEAFFYLLFPVIGYWLLRQPTARVLRVMAGAVSVSVLVPCLIRSDVNAQGIGYWIIYIFPPYRLAEFVLGITLCIAVQRGALPRVPVGPTIVLCLAALVAGMWVPLWAMWVCLTVVPFGLLIVGCAQANLAGATTMIMRTLSHRRLIRLGEWSFAFYLVHALVLGTVGKLLGNSLTGTGERLSVLVIAGCIAVAAAYVLHHVVEQPWERRLRPDHRLPLVAGSAPASG